MSEELLELVLPERVERMDWVLDRRLVGLTVLLEDVHKPQNMGACMRTIEALGILDVHVIEHSAEFVPNPKVTRGCHKWMRLHRHPSAGDAVRALKADGFRILATSPHATATLEDLDFSTPAALCFGNELDGMTDELMSLCDETFKIPMFGFSESFNISVSVGICLHAAAAARRAALGADSDLTPDQRAALRVEWAPRMRKGSERILDAMARQRADE